MKAKPTTENPEGVGSSFKLIEDTVSLASDVYDQYISHQDHALFELQQALGSVQNDIETCRTQQKRSREKNKCKAETLENVEIELLTAQRHRSGKEQHINDTTTIIKNMKNELKQLQHSLMIKTQEITRMNSENARLLTKAESTREMKHPSDDCCKTLRFESLFESRCRFEIRTGTHIKHPPPMTLQNPILARVYQT